MWKPTVSSDELYHHGILGQKWGTRNGPPYPLSAGAHSSSEKAAGYKKSLGGGRNESLYGRGRDDKKDSKHPAEKIPEATSKAADSANNLARKAARKDRKKLQDEVDTSELSNKDMERYIRRKKLEQEYKDIKTKDVELGKEKLADVLDTVKDVSAIAASAATIAVAIAKLKGMIGGKKKQGDATTDMMTQQQIQQIAIQEANRTASLGLSSVTPGMPTTPFLFGKNKQGGFLADRKAAKEQKKADKAYRNEVSNYAIDKGDEYDKTPEAKNAKKGEKVQKQVDKIQKDIDSFKGHEDGIYDNKGRELLSKDDVSSIVNSLKDQKQKIIDKAKSKGIDNVQGGKYDDNIRDYRKTYDEAERMSNDADNEWKKAKDQYNALGKNRIERIKKASKNDTPEAKAYTDQFNKSSDMSDAADEKFREAKEKYKGTGKTSLTRVVNNIAYDVKNKKKLTDSQGSARPERMQINKSDSAVTKRVKDDYNNLSDKEFKQKYKTTKDVYAKRVEKWGDPYKNAPLAQLGKELSTRQKEKGDKLNAKETLETMMDVRKRYKKKDE